MKFKTVLFLMLSAMISFSSCEKDDEFIEPANPELFATDLYDYKWAPLDENVVGVEVPPALIDKVRDAFGDKATQVVVSENGVEATVDFGKGLQTFHVSYVNVDADSVDYYFDNFTRPSIEKFLRDIRPETMRAAGVNVDAQHKYFSSVMTASYLGSDNYTERFDENFTITPVYSYNEKTDYYLVEQELITYNGDLQWQKRNFKYDGSGCIGSFGSGGGIRTDNYLLVNGKRCPTMTQDGHNVRVTQMSPQTTTGSSSFTTGSTISIGGNIGGSATGPTGGLTGGYTLSSSHTTNIPDVTVTNQSNWDDCGVSSWSYHIAYPYIHSDYTNTKDHRMQVDAPVALARTTASFYNSWIWVVENQGATPASVGVYTNSFPELNAVWGYQNWVGSQHTWTNRFWTQGGGHTITFTAPKRD